MRCIAERLIDVALHVRVQGNHLADGHACLLVVADEAKQSRLRSFFCGWKPRRHFSAFRKQLRLQQF
jgi:hypothetical protein